jgi:hypothetical protein
MLVVIGILIAFSGKIYSIAQNLIKSNKVYLINLLEVLNFNINRFDFLVLNSNEEVGLDSVVKNYF